MTFQKGPKRAKEAGVMAQTAKWRQCRKSIILARRLAMACWSLVESTLPSSSVCRLSSGQGYAMKLGSDGILLQWLSRTDTTNSDFRNSSTPNVR
jgi:hypothetical protein